MLKLVEARDYCLVNRPGSCAKSEHARDSTHTDPTKTNRRNKSALSWFRPKLCQDMVFISSSASVIVADRPLGMYIACILLYCLVIVPALSCESLRGRRRRGYPVPDLGNRISGT